MGKKPQGAKNFWGTVKRLVNFMGPWKWSFLVVLIFAVGSVIFQIRTPKILGEATTTIFAGIMKGYQQMKMGQQLSAYPIDFTKIKHILLVVAVMYLISAALAFAQQVIMANVSQKIVYKLRKNATLTD